MPKLFAVPLGLVFLITFFFSGDELKAQPLGHSMLMPEGSISPWDLRMNDSIYRLHHMQLTGNRAFKVTNATSNRFSETRSEILPTQLKSLFQATSLNPTSEGLSNRQATAICYTISGRNFLYQDSLIMWTGQPTLLRDGNIIVSGQFANYGILPLKGSGGFCMKTDQQGNVLWAKLYDSAVHVGYDYINYFRSIELRDGSILLAGRTANKVSGNDDFIITKLSSTGVMIWTKTYQSCLWKGFNVVTSKQALWAV